MFGEVSWGSSKIEFDSDGRVASIGVFRSGRLLVRAFVAADVLRRILEQVPQTGHEPSEWLEEVAERVLRAAQ